jgi:hypothetical protein
MKMKTKIDIERCGKIFTCDVSHAGLTISNVRVTEITLRDGLIIDREWLVAHDYIGVDFLMWDIIEWDDLLYEA